MKCAAMLCDIRSGLNEPIDELGAMQEEALQS
jgi:hypothetical protein